MALSNQILTIADFTHPYKVFEKHLNNDGNEKYFDQILQKSQKDFLKDLLGYRMYRDLVLNYDSAVTNDFWYYLINGTTYTYNDESYIYPGVKTALMRHSYYDWQRWNADQLTSSGGIKQSYKEATKIIPADKMVTAINEMVDMVISSDAYEPTIYHFIDTQYTGDNWDYKGFEKINQYNL